MGYSEGESGKFVHPKTKGLTVKRYSRVKQEREIKAIFYNMRENKEILLETTKYPQSMEHIERYDKGSKSYM